MATTMSTERGSLRSFEEGIGVVRLRDGNRRIELTPSSLEFKLVNVRKSTQTESIMNENSASYLRNLLRKEGLFLSQIEPEEALAWFCLLCGNKHVLLVYRNNGAISSPSMKLI
jgi:hypothetical protein